MESCVRIILVGLFVFVFGCGDDRVDGLVARLKNADVNVRRQAARALGEMRSAVQRAEPELIEATRDRDSEVRRLAGHALGQLGSAGSAAVPALVALLNDPEWSVRLSAALSIQKIRPDEQSHVAVLIGAMRMGEGGVIVKVGEMGIRAQWAVPVLTDLLRDHRPGVRRLAAEALGKIGPDPAAQSALQKALRDPDSRVREAARQSVRKLEPAAHD